MLMMVLGVNDIYPVAFEVPVVYKREHDEWQGMVLKSSGFNRV